jgi:hypothetical protein
MSFSPIEVEYKNIFQISQFCRYNNKSIIVLEFCNYSVESLSYRTFPRYAKVIDYNKHSFNAEYIIKSA